MTTDAQKRAVAKYDRENAVSLVMKLNRKTDQDILARLAAVESKQGYIKRLIREDIARDK